jgi:hypothetical protein
MTGVRILAVIFSYSGQAPGCVRDHGATYEKGDDESRRLHPKLNIFSSVFGINRAREIG